MHGHVRVQGAGLLAAGSHLEELAWLARDRLGDCARVPAGLRDPALREGVQALADLAGDLLEVLADDLDLLATQGAGRGDGLRRTSRPPSCAGPSR